MSPSSAPTPQEGEVYYPEPAVVAQATVPDWEALAKFAQADLAGFWAQRAEELEWFKKWDHGAGRVQPAVLQVVCGRPDEHRPQRR